MRRPAPSCAGLALALLAFGAVLLGGCGLFSPTEPEPPVRNDCAPDTEFQPDYDTPTDALETMSRAMLIKARGRCGYIGAFADSSEHGVPFHHDFPDELEAERQRINLPTPIWNRALEERTFYNDFMELTDGPFDLTWSPYDEAGSDFADPETGDSTLFRRYVVTPRGGAELLAAGVAELVFRQVQNRQGQTVWVLIKWRDQVDSSLGGDTSFQLDLTASQRRLEAYDANF